MPQMSPQLPVPHHVLRAHVSSVAPFHCWGSRGALQRLRCGSYTVRTASKRQTQDSDPWLIRARFTSPETQTLVTRNQASPGRREVAPERDWPPCALEPPGPQHGRRSHRIPRPTACPGPPFSPASFSAQRKHPRSTEGSRHVRKHQRSVQVGPPVWTHLQGRHCNHPRPLASGPGYGTG